MADRRVQKHSVVHQASRARVYVEQMRSYVRIDEDVSIDQDHLKLSPSAMASASPMLSIVAMRTRPSATARVRTGSRGP